MYERLNLFLKRMNKNKNNTFPSIVRNYAVRFNFFYFIIALFLIYICFKIAVYLLYYCSIFALIFNKNIFLYVQLEEKLTQLIGYNFSTVSRILRLIQFMPINFNIVKKVLTSFSNLHVEGGTVYSLPISRVHELRKKSKWYLCDKQNVVDLVTISGKHSI
jgi:hypothetical protein